MTQLFPQFSPAVSAQRTELPLYRDVMMDYDTGRPVWESGSPVFVTGLEAVKGWAWRAIDTARYRFPCFSWSYGCELEALTGQRGGAVRQGSPAGIPLYPGGTGIRRLVRGEYAAHDGGDFHSIREGAHPCLRTRPQPP